MSKIHTLTMDQGTENEKTYIFNCAKITSIVVDGRIIEVTMDADAKQIQFGTHEGALELANFLIAGMKD